MNGAIPGGSATGGAPVLVGLATPVPVPVPVPGTGDRPLAELGIGYGAVVAEVVKDGISVAKGAGAELVVGTGKGTAEDDETAALDEATAESEAPGGN